MEKEHVICPNCENEFDKDFQFCPHCGQKAKDELTLGVLFYNTISNYFSFDARFFKSFIPLMVKPGYLAKKFLEGKRLLFLHPAQMYLFISVVFFFLFSFKVRKQTQEIDLALQKDLKESSLQINDSITDPEPALDSIQIEELMKPLKDNQAILGLKDEDLKVADSLIKTNAKNTTKNNMTFDFDETKVDSLIAIDAPDAQIYKSMGMDDDAGFITRKFYAQMLKFYKERGLGSLMQTFYDSIPLALFFLLPIFAFILKVLYYNKGQYAHHLVFSFYFFSFLFTVFSLLVLYDLIFEISGWITTLIMLSTFFYLFFAVKRLLWTRMVFKFL